MSGALWPAGDPTFAGEAGRPALPTAVGVTERA